MSSKTWPAIGLVSGRPDGAGEDQSVAAGPVADLLGKGVQDDVVGGNAACRGAGLESAHVSSGTALLAHVHGAAQEVDVLGS
jgi:hypothetical protein